MRRAVCVLAFVPDPFRLLVLRRRPERVAGWQPVTGRVEPDDAARPLPPHLAGVGDAALVGACVRELAEEAGLPPPEAMLDLAQEVTFRGYDGAAYAQRTFAARYADARAPRLSVEHEAARWVPAAEARALLTWAQNRDALDLLLARLHPEKDRAF